MNEVKGYKVFNPDWTCNNFQYEVGKTYQHKVNMNYVMHVCKNSKLKPNNPDYCDRAWIDEDLHNTQKPPTWKYCVECEKKGFKNPKRRNYYV